MYTKQSSCIKLAVRIRLERNQMHFEWKNIHMKIYNWGKNSSWGGCVCRWRLTLKRVHLLLLPFIYYLLCFHTTGEKTSSQPAEAKEEEKGMECHVSRKWKWCNRERPTKTASEGGITSLRLITGQKLGWRHFRCAGILYFQSYVLWGAVEVEVQWACWSGIEGFFCLKQREKDAIKGPRMNPIAKHYQSSGPNWI